MSSSNGWDDDASLDRALRPHLKRPYQLKDGKPDNDSIEALQLQRWQYAIRQLLQTLYAKHPFQDYNLKSDLIFSVRYFGKQGLVAASFKREGVAPETGQVLVKLGLGQATSSSECTCNKYISEQICSHITKFAKILGEELSDKKSATAKRILENHYSGGTFDYHEFLAARSSLTLAGLAAALPASEDETADSLPDVKATAPARLVWAFHTSKENLRLQLIYQKQKKRGNGWLKGQKLAPDSLLLDDSLLVTEQDRLAAKCIKRSSTQPYYYGPTYKVDYPALIQKLIGHPCVTLNDQPVEPTESALMLIFGDCGNYLQLRVAVPFTPSSDLHSHPQETGFVYCDANSSILHAIPCTANQLKFMKNLERSPVIIEKQQLAAHRQDLERIGKHIPVVLPREIAGEVQVEPIQPAILLRSRASGELDFGMRMRDAQGRLNVPGQGSAIHYKLNTETPVQWRRDLTKERKVALDLADQLRLSDLMDEQEFFGSLQDFKLGIDLLETLDTLKDQIEVCWDRSTERRPSVVGSLTASNLRVQLSTKRDWFGIEGQCAFNDKTIDLTDIISALSRNDGDSLMQGEFIKLGDDQWARISQRLQQRLKRLADHAHMERGKLKIDRTGVHSVEALLDEQVTVEAPKKWAETVARLRSAETLDPVVPAGLQADLRSYQTEGFAWMRRLAEWGVGGVLADDMGLGKTVQTLAVLIDRKNAGPAIVIAPTSVGFNWARETARFAPELKVHLYRDTDRLELLEQVGPGDVVILSYGLVLRDESQLAKVNWGTMVLDEAQAVKNSRSKTSQAIANIDADWKLALTGTPVENHLGELWSIFRIVSPGLLGGWDQFRNKFAAPIERDNNPERRAALSNLLQPFILRRTKSAVLKDLPERTEANLYVDLSKEERAAYDTWRMAAIGEIEGLENLTGSSDSRFQILAILTRLRQLACNVGLVDKSWQGESSKLALLMEKMEELRSEGHRVLIFSQFTEHLSKIRAAFDAAKISYQYLDGSTPAKQRSQLVDRFQAGEGDAFLISLKAGGTGLNLTAADYVIHMDPWWNPAVEDQATDRAHRIGQTRPVIVYRIIARNTIEEEILALHETKRDLVAGILDGTSKAAKLSTNELIALIRKG